MTTTTSLAVVLGGGGALGAAHVGVLQALEERGIRPSIVAGTSAGSLVGAAYAADIPMEAIEQAVRSATWSSFGQITLAPRLGLLDTTALARSIAAMLGTRTLIEELPRPFAAVATDLLTRKPVTFTAGNIYDALRASIAVPGLFPPVIVNKRILIDGGLADNLPVEAARHLGAQTVIAVRLRPDSSPVLLIRPSARTARIDRGFSTLLIEPDTQGLAQWSGRDVHRLIEAGRIATEAGLASLPTSWFSGAGSPLAAGVPAAGIGLLPLRPASEL